MLESGSRRLIAKGGYTLYETIIAAVGAILANIFPAIIYDRKETVRNLDIRLTKLEHDLDAELRKSGTGYSELHMNQSDAAPF